MADELSVASVMTTNVVIAQPETPFCELVETMAENGISALPVLDRRGYPIGVVSEADIFGEQELHGPYGYRVAGQGRWSPMQEWSAAEVMSTQVRAVHSTESVSFAAGLLARASFRRLFVTDWDGRLVGVVSRRDLLRARLHEGMEVPCHIGSS